jgi:hypothetical protein
MAPLGGYGFRLGFVKNRFPFVPAQHTMRPLPASGSHAVPRPFTACFLATAALLGGCTTVNTVQVQQSAPQQSTPIIQRPVIVRPVVATQPIRRPNPAAALTVDDVGVLPYPGQHFTGAIYFLGRNTPLPQGDWMVIQVSKVANPHGLPNADVVLLRRNGNQFSGMFEIKGNSVTRPAIDGFAVSGVCTMGDAIFSDVRAAEPGGAQDCLAILFQHTIAWRAARAPRTVAGFARDLDQLGVPLPPTLITAAFEACNKNFQLYEQVWLNPETDGIGPDHSSRRADSDWAAYNLHLDPEREQYIDGIRSWANDWRGVLQALIAGPAPILTAEDARLP